MENLGLPIHGHNSPLLNPMAGWAKMDQMGLSKNRVKPIFDF